MNSDARQADSRWWSRKPFLWAILAAVVIHFAFFELFSVPPVDQDDMQSLPGRLVEIDPSSDFEAWRLMGSLLTKRPFLPSFEVEDDYPSFEALDFSSSDIIPSKLEDYQPSYYSAAPLKIDVPLPAVVQAGALKLPNLADGVSGGVEFRFTNDKSEAECSLIGGIEEETKRWVVSGDSTWIGQIWVAHLGISSDGVLEEIIWIDPPAKEVDLSQFELELKGRTFSQSDAKRWTLLNVEWRAADD